VELGAQVSKSAKEGWCTFLNYVGGSYIYIRMKFAVHLMILNSSWATAPKKEEEDLEAEANAAEEGEGAEEEKSEGGGNEAQASRLEQVHAHNFQ